MNILEPIYLASSKVIFAASEVTGTEAGEGSGTEHEGIDLFLPERSEIFWSFVCIVILAIAFYKYILPTFYKMLDERQKQIDGQIREASQMVKDAEEKLSKYNSMMENASKEATEIKNDAKEQAAKIVSDATDEAKQKAKQIELNAERSVEVATKQAYQALKVKISDMSLNVASIILKQNLKLDDSSKKNIETTIKELEKTDFKYTN
ncbi:MAG: F0F1 ATP synthase subunit B [Bifidobacteriaceae bacterium]|jgi:F-type H+-transporting ATPase subunit b|nr:F0F1 ATP synthase subunit B [Bifidobacteriaceae bacterium]